MKFGPRTLFFEVPLAWLSRLKGRGLLLQVRIICFSAGVGLVDNAPQSERFLMTPALLAHSMTSSMAVQGSGLVGALSFSVNAASAPCARQIRARIGLGAPIAGATW